MFTQLPLRRSVRRPLWANQPLLVLLALLLILANLSATRHQEQTHLAHQKPTGPLSSRLARLAAQPTDSTPAMLAQQLSLPPDGPGSLLRSSSGDVLIYVQATTDQATLTRLVGAGANIVHVNVNYGIITALVAPQQLAAVAGLPGVRHMVEALAPMQPAAYLGNNSGNQGFAQAAPTATCPGGSVVSEGDALLKANEARATYGVDGSGVTVGVLADSFDVERVTQIDAADDVASGDLPGSGNPCGLTAPVNVLAESRLKSGRDEGRGVLQIVHDLAPGANLTFATAADGLFAFADNIRRLRREAGADVLMDDFFYIEEPFFQDGPVNVAIRDVARDGALYVTAGGNIHVEDPAGRPIGSYEAASYRAMDCPQLTDPTIGDPFTPVADCHNFNTAGGVDNDMQITLPPEGRVVINFQWSEPWFGVQTDFDIYLVDEQNTILARSENALGFAPFEALSYDNGTGAAQVVKLVIVRFTGQATPRLKFTLGSAALNRPAPIGLEYADQETVDIFGPTMTDHSSAAEAITVGAVALAAPLKPEPFSSHGPATLYWQNAASIRPAQPLPEAEVRAKPDIMAPNGVRTTFLGRATLGAPRCDPADPANNVCRFFGTSAAAPHAAAVLALMRQRAYQEDVRLTQSRAERLLERSATTMEGTPDTRGAGLINALEAVGAVGR